MNDYDFSTLNDKEFEILCTDLLSEAFGSRIERFKAGKDKGVDGRFFLTPDKQAIFQYKHWPKSGLRALLNYLAKKELPKIAKLKPEQYILAVSLPLSKIDKESISKALSPHIKSESHIFGREDLNDLLKKHSQIEKNHFKLWLSSSNVLITLLNAAIEGRSAFLKSELKEESKKYVFTKNYNEALKKLEDTNNVIITGEPGVGKTTLAKQLLLYHLTLKYELVSIETDLSEAENVLSADKKQIFYFDDFLGQNYLTAMRNRTDSHVLQFMERIRKTPNKKFILTSRTNIFNQGYAISSAFESSNIRQNEFVVSIESYDNFDKARILYNHIWFSELGEAYIEQIFENNRYLNIIKHANFNPRLISFITDAVKVSHVAVSDYWQHIETTLSNPREVWATAYDTQLNEFQRILVMIATFYGKTIAEDLFKASYERYLALNPISSDNLSTDFELHAKILVGSLLTRHLERGKAVYGLFNPSVGDFVLTRIISSTKKMTDLCDAIHKTQPIVNLNALSENRRISAVVCKGIHRDLLVREMAHWEGRSDFTYFLIYSNVIKYSGKDLPENLCSKFEDPAIFKINPSETEYFVPLLWELLSKGLIHLAFDSIKDFLLHVLNAFYTNDDLTAVSNILKFFEVSNGDGVYKRLEAEVEEYWKDNFSSWLSDSSLLDKYFPDDFDEAIADVRECLEEELTNYGVALTNVNLERIIKEELIDSILYDNSDAEGRIEESYDYYKESDRENNFEEQSLDIKIKDLFDRSGQR